MKLKILLITIISLFVIGCGGENTTDKQNETQDLKISIKVGSEGAYKPFSYVDKNGTITGYDVEVLRLLQEIDPDLSFEFNYAPWNALFFGARFC